MARLTAGRMLAQTRKVFKGERLADDYETVAFLCEQAGLKPDAVTKKVAEYRNCPHTLPRIVQEMYNARVLGLSAE